MKPKKRTKKPSVHTIAIMAASIWAAREITIMFKPDQDCAIDHALEIWEATNERLRKKKAKRDTRTK